MFQQEEQQHQTLPPTSVNDQRSFLVVIFCISAVCNRGWNDSRHAQSVDDQSLLLHLLQLGRRLKPTANLLCLARLAYLVQIMQIQRIQTNRKLVQITGTRAAYSDSALDHYVSNSVAASTLSRTAINS